MTTVHPRPRQRARWWRWCAAVAVLTAAVGSTAWMRMHYGPIRHAGYRLRDCVVVATPSAGAELHASRASCHTDPSFIVAAWADRAGNCNPDRYDQFQPPFADEATGHLCLVPNLVVDHCYRFGVPEGMWNLVACATAGAATIKVTKRVDADDPHACPPPPEPPSTTGIRAAMVPRALPYPTRTYCYSNARVR